MKKFLCAQYYLKLIQRALLLCFVIIVLCLTFDEIVLFKLFMNNFLRCE